MMDMETPEPLNDLPPAPGGNPAIAFSDIDGSNKQQLTTQGTGFGIIFHITWALAPQEPQP
jgi:hypothetical protein